MGPLTFDISVSLDGFITGPDVSRENPLGADGEKLHEWIVAQAVWRESHGYGSDGETGVNDQVVRETIANVGAYIMGRRMFGGPPDHGPWGEAPGDGWWGDAAPFRVPVFVVTNHPRETIVQENGTRFVFVTDGIEAALEQARAAAGDRVVKIAGGADAIQQYLVAGLVDEFELHVVPILLGGGTRLFGSAAASGGLEPVRVIDTPKVTHLRYRPVG